jgi:hypothetical protein
MSGPEKKTEFGVIPGQTEPATLPPQKVGQVSGQFRVRQWLENKKTPREELRNPTIGGMLLLQLSAWTSLLPEERNIIEGRILNFIAQDEIPSDEAINAEIQRLSSGGRLRRLSLVAQASIGKYAITLPDDIIRQIEAWMRHFIIEHPEANDIEIICETNRIGNLALIQMNEHESIRPDSPAARDTGKEKK